MTRAFFVLAAMLATSFPAYAYLDPGTGSLLLQGAIAAAAAVFGVLSLWWQQAKQLFQSLTNGTPASSTTTPVAGDAK